MAEFLKYLVAGVSYGSILIIVLFLIPMHFSNIVAMGLKFSRFKREISAMAAKLFAEIVAGMGCVWAFMISATAILGELSFDLSNTLVGFGIACGVILMPLGIICGVSRKAA